LLESSWKFCGFRESITSGCDEIFRKICTFSPSYEPLELNVTKKLLHTLIAINHDALILVNYVLMKNAAEVKKVGVKKEEEKKEVDAMNIDEVKEKLITEGELFYTNYSDVVRLFLLIFASSFLPFPSFLPYLSPP